MNKYHASDITMVRVTENDPHIETSIPLIGIEQGRAHDTKLPDQSRHMPQIADNFRHALREKHVEIWRMEHPVAGIGAIFLSPLEKGGQQGIQVDDIVIMPEYRGQNLGSAQMRFAAALSQSRGGSFIAWECEKNNPAEKMYRSVGATPRDGLIPFRLTKDIILKAIHGAEDLQPVAADTVSFTVSNRFSLFRTVNYGIFEFDETGKPQYDMDPTQRSLGLQIEGLTFDTIDHARLVLSQTLRHYREARGIDFVDIVIPTESDKHLELIKSFDAEQNTYSGNPAFLWELSGDAFVQAAEAGRQIKGLEL